MSDEGMVAIAGLLFLAIIIVPFVFYLITLQKALSRVREDRREMSPGLVWLNLIPIFALGWHIYTVVKVANSLANEFDARAIRYSGKPGLAIGLAAAILFCVSILPYVGMSASIAGIVCWMIYWVQIAGHSKKIAAA